MGGPGSGGFKNSPGDVDVHDAWEVLEADPNNAQKLPIVRCRYCFKSHARHTSRQRTHLVTCEPYLSAMTAQNISNSITRAAADLSNGSQPPPTSHPTGTGSVPTVTRKSLSKASSHHPSHHHGHQGHTAQGGGIQRFQEHPLAIKIQALALAEANISESFIYECTGVDARTLAMLRRVARERGLDPSKSRVLKEEYVTNLPLSGGVEPPLTPTLNATPATPLLGAAAAMVGKKRQREPSTRDRETEDGGDLNGEDNGGGGGGAGGSDRRGGTGGGSGSGGGMRAPPGYLGAESLPPGNWNFAGGGFS